LQCNFIIKDLETTNGNKARHWWPKFSGDNFAPQMAQLLVPNLPSAKTRR